MLPERTSGSPQSRLPQ